MNRRIFDLYVGEKCGGTDSDHGGGCPCLTALGLSKTKQKATAALYKKGPMTISTLLAVFAPSSLAACPVHGNITPASLGKHVFKIIILVSE
jgi:hypothetical protein